MKRLALVLVLVFAAGLLAADAGGSPEARVWNLTSYLKGTPSQIRQSLYRDVIRLDGATRDTERQLDEAKGDLSRDKAACLNQCRARPDYRWEKSERDAAEKAMRQGRLDGDVALRVESSSRFNKAKAAMDKLEAAALAGDRIVAGDEHRVTELTARLSDQQKSLADAIAWKDHLLAVSANSFRLDWPLTSGAKGFLGSVKVSDVLDGAIVANYTAIEWTGEKDAGEEIAVRNGYRHDVKLVVPCSDPGKYHRGSTVLLNRTFEVATAKAVGDELYYVMREAPSDEDKLWQTISAPVTPEELHATTQPSVR